MRGGLVAALGFLVLTGVNASWLAPDPKGAPKLIAHRGIDQISNPEADGPDDCTATHIEQPHHKYLGNTAPAIARAAKLGAHLVEIDVMPTADGQIAVFDDQTLDCRTDGTGKTSALTMPQLKALDAGYGHTADDGKTYPLRGTGVGAIPTIDEAMKAAGRARLIYHFKDNDPAQADAVAAAMQAGITSIVRNGGARGDVFYGAPEPVARIRELFPEAWAFTGEEVEACTSAYLAIGWTGIVPEACENATITVPLNKQWAYWGWPNRMIARMEAAGTRIIVTGPDDKAGPLGLVLPEQLGEIPSSFNGYVRVDDAFAIVPALISRFDDRDQAEIDASWDAVKRRRQAMD